MTLTIVAIVLLFVVMVFREFFFWLAGCFVFWLIGRPWK